ncbi:hypothetical protein FRB98_007175 [Tulasnella sp. 332]|nr:hypothetical protein FRB98_007175 [Tulasnella sp. 332]
MIALEGYLEYIQHGKPFGVYILPLVSGILTIVILPFMIVLDRLRRDAAVHQPRVELLWAGFVCLLWLASAMLVSLELKGFPKCSLYKGLVFPWNHHSEEAWCRINIAAEGLLWAGFIISFGTVIGITVFVFYNSAAGYQHVWTTAISDFERQPTKETTESRRSSRRHSARIRDLEETFSGLSTEQVQHPSQVQLQQRYEAAAQEGGEGGEGESPPSPSAFPRPPSPSLSVKSAMRALGYTTPRRDNISTRATMAHQHSSNSLLDTPPSRPPCIPRTGESQDSRTSLQSAAAGTAA